MQDGDAEAAVGVDVGVVEGADKLEVWVPLAEARRRRGKRTYQADCKGSFGGRSFWLCSSRRNRASRS